MAAQTLGPKELSRRIEEAKQETLQRQPSATSKEQKRSFLGEFWKKAHDSFSVLQIRVKLIIATATIVILTVLLFSVIVLQSGKSLLTKRMEETCSLAVRNLSSQMVKDQLLALAQNDSNLDKSIPTAILKEAVLDVLNLKIQGVKYAEIIDRNDIIIAHTDFDKIGEKVNLQQKEIIDPETETYSRELGSVFEYIFPIYMSKDDTKERVPIGTTIIGFSKKQVLRPINQIATAIFGVALLVVIVSISFIFIFARRMTAQIDLLAIGVRQIGKGNLDFRVPIKTRDELGHLSKEFNKLIIHLREKRHMQKFVSQLTMDMIKEKRTREDLLPVGEMREVTLFFSDVRNFSAMTEELGPEEIVKLINIYLDLQARIVEEHGGIVDKFMGDQIMAIFMGDDMADRAVRTAVTAQRAIREMNKRRQKNGEVVLTVGCGLNDGPVVMGNMGSRNRLDYTVLGDVVNLASRLCAIARPGQIIAPIKLGEKLRGDYPTIRLEPVMVKGRSRPVEIFEIDYDRAIIM